MKQNHRYEFGPYRLDTGERVLWRGDEIVRLTPKIVETLLVLVESEGRVVTKEELMSRVWPDTTVEEANLTQNVFVLRKSLGNDGCWIETIPKRGYRFVGNVRVAADTQVENGSAKPQIIETHHRIRIAPAWVAAAISLGVIGAWWLAQQRMGKEANPVLRQLTADPGAELYPVFSPDGRRVLYVSDGGQPRSVDLYVKAAEAGNLAVPVRLTNDAAAECYPAWSSDGSWIAFLHCDAGLGAADTEVFVMPASGGAKREIGRIHVVDHLDYPMLAWSGDSQYVIATDRPGLVRLPIGVGRKQPLTIPPSHVRGDGSPAVSFDGRNLVFVRSLTYAGSDLFALDIEQDGSPRENPRRVTEGKALMTNPMWRNNRELLYCLHQGGAMQLFRIDTSGNHRPQHVALPAPLGIHATLARGGDMLAFADHRGDTDIWRVDLVPGKNNPAGAARLISSTRNDANPQISPDGTRIAFASERSGNQEVWLADSDGSNIVQLTSSGHPSGTPRWSPDGKQLAFDLTLGGNADIYVIDARGGSPRRLTDTTGPDNVPSWSHNGHWIYFNSRRAGGKYDIWRVPALGGAATRVTQGGGFNALESFDRRFVYYSRDEDGATGVWRIPSEGGKEELVLPSIRSWVHFTLAPSGIYFVPDAKQDNRLQVQYYPFDARQVQTVATVDFGSHGFGLAVSPNADWLLLAPTEFGRSDIQLIENLP